jgi:hypothetical protein
MFRWLVFFSQIAGMDTFAYIINSPDLGTIHSDPSHYDVQCIRMLTNRPQVHASP